MSDDAAGLTPGLLLVHGNRAEQLRDVLVSWMQHTPLAPLENECVLVQSNGIAQWLRMALAQDDCGGIAAALEFLLPSRFMWQAYRSVLGADAVPETSALDKEPLSWRLMRLLPALIDQPAYTVLQGFLADDGDVRKRYQLAGRLADLFDQYQVYRADWLQAWAAGRDVLIDRHGTQTDLPDKQLWQAHLWRALLLDLAADPLAPAMGPVGRAAVHQAFMQQVAAASADQRPVGLPRRILVFGLSSMARQTFEALAGLSRWVQVLVCVHNPCEHYWADIQGEREQLRARFRRQTRRPGMPDTTDGATLHQQTHPLLASWGRQGRDYIGMLDDFDDPDSRAQWQARLAGMHQRIDVFEPSPANTLLAQLQDDIRDLRPLAETQQRWPAIDPVQDGSIQFQVAHSAQREVEILQDQLLAAFQADPSLRPRDVIVMVPDIEAYAPHIQAVFGLYDRRDPRHIPFALADRRTRQTEPLVVVLEQLLSLPTLRLGLNEVLEWLELPALRQRFGIDAADLPLLQAWAHESGVRWGLHAEHRASFDLNQDPQAARNNTWQFGVQRMLLGYAVGPDAPTWQGIAPYGEPTGLEAAALGGLARFLDVLDQYWRRLSVRATPQQWAQVLQSLLADCFLPQDDSDALILSRFREIVQDWLACCEAAGLDEPLPAAIVTEHCLSRLDQGGLSQRFFAGAVTFATLMPMRAIPFRRVCLMGMQDKSFPRVLAPSDMDLMATLPRPGDRSRREDDRYLFLEALLSAREQFYVSWIGHSIQDNAEQPPCVLLAQLCEHLDRGWRCVPDDRPLSGALTCHHPLQPFSRRYFSAPGAGPQALFTYAAEWRAAVSSVEGSDVLAGQVSVNTLLSPPIRPERPLALQAIQSFLKSPVKAFYQQRLQVYFQEQDAGLEEDEPYLLDGLQRWKLNERLLRGLEDAAAQAAQQGQSADLDGLSERLEEEFQFVQDSGAVPSGALGAVTLADFRASMQRVLTHYLDASQEWPQVDIEPLRLSLGVPGADGQAWPLEDTLRQWRCDDQGNWCRILMQASQLVGSDKRYRYGNLVQAWVEHVAAHVQGRSTTTVLISPKGTVRFHPLLQTQALAVWQTWWRWRHQGLCEALPTEVSAAGAWLRAGAVAAVDSKSWANAQVAYDHALTRDLYLRSRYPDFSGLLADGRFFQLANELYGALLSHLPAREAKSSPGASRER